MYLFLAYYVQEYIILLMYQCISKSDSNYKLFVKTYPVAFFVSVHYFWRADVIVRMIRIYRCSRGQKSNRDSLLQLFSRCTLLVSNWFPTGCFWQNNISCTDDVFISYTVDLSFNPQSIIHTLFCIISFVHTVPNSFHWVIQISIITNNLAEI